MTINKNRAITKKFGQKLKAIRNEKRMSQGDIARSLGVHRSYISGLERGIRNPTLANIERIAKSLGIKIAKLLEE